MGSVETLLGGRVGVDLTNEGESAVEVGVPRDGTRSQEGRRSKGCAGVDKRLEKPTILNTQLTKTQCKQFAPRTQRRRQRKSKQNGHAASTVSVSPEQKTEQKNAPEGNARR